MSQILVSQDEFLCFSQLFERQVKQNPNAVAVACGQHQLSYRELNQAANLLGRRLRDLGVRPGVLVGLYVDRSLDLAIGILGILKSGGTYVPLDPKHPRERSLFVLEETKVSLILSQTHLLQDLEEIQVQKICLDEWRTHEYLSVEGTLNDEKNLEPIAQSSDLAYIMYTSGSTGKPKGVQISRESIWYYLQGIRDRIPLGAKDVYLHTASTAFSSSIRHLMFPLSKGAKVVIATREHIQNPLALFHLIEEQEVNVLDTVASVWRHGISLLNASGGQNSTLLRRSKLRILIFSGGLLPCRLLHEVLEQFDRRPQVFNIYGQTETIGVSTYAVPQRFNREEGYVPVGQPYSHNQVHILDEALQPVADGEPGELCIVGKNLAQGYLKRAESNLERFVVTAMNDRLFKTGDVARILPDGNLEILGRTDFQVKIRGMRVELEEIATILEQHPDVKEAALAAQEDHLGEKILVAYVVPEVSWSNLHKEHQKLRDFLKAKLPDYMLPSIFVDLDFLPLTPNGKLNRLALPKPEALKQQAISQPATISPIQAIFCRTFNISQVRPEDTFISLGGHSLNYVQVSIQLEKYLGKVPAKWESMTLEELETLVPLQIKNTTIETDVLLRAAAILTIVLNHAIYSATQGSFEHYFTGSSLPLLLIAGLNLARFQSDKLLEGKVFKSVTPILRNLIIPYLLINLIYEEFFERHITPSILLLFDNFQDSGAAAVEAIPFPYWFICLLVQLIVILSFVLSIKPWRHYAKSSPWLFGIILLIFGLCINLLSKYVWYPNEILSPRTPQVLFWVFALGWCINFAKFRFEKVITTGLLVGGTFLHLLIWGMSREPFWILIPGIMLLWLNFVPIPAVVKSVLQTIASATFYIYMAHMGFIALANIWGVSDPLICLMAGLLGSLFIWFSIQKLRPFLRASRWVGAN